MYVRQVTASSTGTVDATVKISICGNLQKEGGEDCDNLDLGGATCTSLGYGGGDLTCDISCSYNTTECLPPTPTPTPSPTPIPTATPTPSPGTDDASTDSTEENTVVLATPTTTQITTTPQVFTQPTLPAPLQFFDVRGTGKILVIDLPVVVQLWVTEWKAALDEELARNESADSVARTPKKCDINNDQICNLKDFSVLMYYVESE